MRRLHAVQGARAPHLHRPDAPVGRRLPPPSFMRDFWHYVDIDPAEQRAAKTAHESGRASPPTAAARRCWPLPRPPGAPPTAAARRRAARCCAMPFAVAETELRPGADQRPLLAHRHRRTSSRRCTPTTTWRGPSRSGRSPRRRCPRSSDDFRTWTIRIRPGIYFADDPAFKGKRRELVAAGLRLRVQALRRPGQQEPDLRRRRGARACSASTSCARRRSTTRSRSTTTRRVEGMRALDRYTLQFKLERAAPALPRHARRPATCSARWRARWSSSTATQIDAHPVGTGPFRLGAVAAQLAASCSSATRPTARCCYDGEPGRRRRRGPGAARALQGPPPADGRPGRGLDHRGEPAALARASSTSEIDVLPVACRYEFVDAGRCPNGKLAPNLAKRGIADARASSTPTARSTYFNMEDPVVGGYTPEKVALRRAISLAYDVDARDPPASAAARRSRRSRRSRRTPSATTRRFKSEMSDYDPARAKALLDMFGYVDRDGDGWRELPDGKPLVLEMRDRSPTQIYAPVRRAVEEEHGRGRHPHRASAPRKWPENLKAARAGKLMMWQLGYSSAAPDGQDALAALYGPAAGGQNLARFKLAALRRDLRAHAQSCPTAPSGWRCSARPSDAGRRLHAVQVQRRTASSPTWCTLGRRLSRGRCSGNQWWHIRRHRRRQRQESLARSDLHRSASAMSSPEPQILRYTRWLREHARPRVRPDYDGGYDALALVGATTCAASGSRSGTTSTIAVADAARDACWSSETMPGARWFDGAQVNYAQQVLRHADAAHAAGHPAIVFRDEAMQRAGERIEIALARAAPPGRPRSRRRSRAWACSRGDRVVRLPAERAADGGRLPRLRQPRRDLVGLLARHGAGGGARPLPPDRAEGADRLRRLPLRRRRARPRARCCASCSSSCRACAHVVLLPLLDAERRRRRAAPAPRARAHDFDALRRRRRARSQPSWLPFDHPLWVVYSSGTTGLPKPIVHGHGGVMLEALKLGTLHNNIGPSVATGDRFHWYSAPAGSCGTARSAALLGGTTICLFDGSPGGAVGRRRTGPRCGASPPRPAHLLRRRRRVLRELPEGRRRAAAASADLSRAARARLDRLAAGERVLPLGLGPLPKVDGRDIWLTPMSRRHRLRRRLHRRPADLPVVEGEMQCRCLGAAVEAWSEPDAAAAAEPDRRGRRARLHAADAVDAARTSGATPTASALARQLLRHVPRRSGATATGSASRPDGGGAIIYGRSDATINRHGIRMGTAELYRAVEALPEVLDSLVVDLEYLGRESWMPLFVVLREGHALDEALTRAHQGRASATALSAAPRAERDLPGGRDPAHAVGQEDGAAGQEAAAGRAGRAGVQARRDGQRPRASTGSSSSRGAAPRPEPRYARQQVRQPERERRHVGDDQQRRAHRARRTAIARATPPPSSPCRSRSRRRASARPAA